MAVGVLVNSFAQVPYCLIQAVARPDVTAKIHFGELPFHTLLMWMLVKHWGISGAALAWFIPVMVDAVILFFAAGSLLSVGADAFVFDKGISAVLVLCAFAGGTVLIAGLPFAVGCRLLALAMAMVPMGLTVWLYLFDDSDRLQLLRLLPIGSRK